MSNEAVAIASELKQSPVRHYTTEELRDAARELLRGKKCPHGRRVTLVSFHVEVREALSGTDKAVALVVEAACPHEEDQRSMTFERSL